jgi:tellurite resistance-related uncharacterized protein
MIAHLYSLNEQNTDMIADKWHEVEEVDEDIIKKLALYSRGDLSPMVRVIHFSSS